MPMEAFMVLAIVAIAAGYTARTVWKAVQAARKPRGGCGSDCGCGH